MVLRESGAERLGAGPEGTSAGKVGAVSGKLGTGTEADGALVLDMRAVAPGVSSAVGSGIASMFVTACACSGCAVKMPLIQSSRIKASLRPFLHVKNRIRNYMA